MAPHALVLVLAAAASASEPVRSAAPDDLAVLLTKVRNERAFETRRAVMGEAEELRDAVAAVSAGPDKKRLMQRLPGMAPEPFAVCRGGLSECREAPASLHVDDHELADDAFLALARPWFALQEARGKTVTVTVDPGAGVRLELEDLPAFPVVVLSAAPTPTGGFDVAVEDGEAASKAWAAARAAALTPGS